MTSESSSTSNVDFVDLREVAKEVYRKKWYLSTTALVVGLLSAFSVSLLRDTYESSASIKIESTQLGPSLGFQSFLSGSGNATAETEASIMTSRTVMIEAINRGNLTVYTQPVPQRLKYLTSKIRSIAGLDNAEEEIEPRLEVIARSYPQELYGQSTTITYQGDRRITIETPRGDIMEGFVGEEIHSPSGDVSLQVSNVAASPGDKFVFRVETVEDSLSQLRRKLSVQEIGSTRIIELRYKDYTSDRVYDVLSAIVDSYISSDTEHAVTTAQQSLEYIESQIDPALEAIRNAEDALTSYQIESETVNVEIETEFLLRQMLELEQRLRENQRPGERETLERIRDEYRQQLASLPDTQQQTLNLTRNIEVAQTLYIELMKRVQETRALRVSAQGNARVIDHPYTPVRPTGPRRSLLVLALVVGAMFLHVIFIFLSFSGKAVRPVVRD